VENKGWNWAEGEHNNKQGYFVKADNRKIMTKKGMQSACIHIDYEGIKKLPDIQPIDKALPNLDYVTRIVGYYSKIQNWNPSKQGELIERGMGKYGI